ncbi:MAG: hypothetical protein R3B09_26720 [Nannocystaceae bacterium]
MATRADETEEALRQAIEREKNACIRAQRVSFVLWTLGAGVAGFISGGYAVYTIMRKR